MNIHLHLYLLLVFFWLGGGVFAQYVVQGKIVDENGDRIPFADVYVKNYPEYRTRADQNGDYLMRLEVGEYYMVFSAMSYQPKEYYLIVKERDQIVDIQLFPVKVKDLEGIDISAKRKNVGREIVKKTIEIKNQIDFNQYAHTSNIYIRAQNKTIGKKINEEDEEEDWGDARFDDIETLKEKQMGKLGGINMIEVEMQRDFAPPNHLKEIRTGFQKLGSERHLYYTTTAKSDFNFFKNILYLNDLSKNPIQSPISTAGILSYKYKLVEKIERDSLPTLNKIQITPRNIATSTLEGYVYIQDSTWLLEKVDFSIDKGNLFIFDDFSIQQEFDVYGDTLCVLKHQEMEYHVSYNRQKYEGKTTVHYKDFDFSPEFPRKHFGSELAVTTQEAYERDSSYWENKRLKPLTPEEQKFIQKRDSIEQLFAKQEYLDSIDSVFNKPTFWKVVWFGVDYRNRAKKTQWTLSSLAAMIRPIYIAGPRVGPDFEIYKKWDNEQSINSFSRVDVGILNGDVKGFSNLEFLYGPFRQARIGAKVTHNYDLIRSYDALTQILLRDNFIIRTGGSIYHDFELFNGLYLETDFLYAHRRPLPEDTKFLHWLDKPLDNYTDPPSFERYHAFISTFTLRFTPFQKYMREPKRKVILGSKWPTFYLTYEKGIPKIFGSEVNHDYLGISARQTFKIGTMGTSTYRLATGKFLNTKALHEADYKFHRRADPLLFSNPLYSFQGLDSTLPTKNWYLEAHYIHHFNGALINKIPFMKKTRITTVGGAGYLWVPEHNWVHYEFYGGLERIFKFARRRLRIGAYVAFSHSNHTDPRPSFKISFAILDERDMKFNF